jgi:hypothetical protein
VRLPYRIVALFGTLAVAASLGGCNNDPLPMPPPPSNLKPAPEAPPKIAVVPEPKDMKPADGKTPEGKAPGGKVVDELPPLVPPAGSKDERPDAKPK